MLSDDAAIRRTYSDPDLITPAGAAAASAAAVTPVPPLLPNSPSFSPVLVPRPRSWSARIKLLGLGRRNPGTALARLTLTQASLEEHNQRQDAAIPGKNTRRSPYYKGLTDSSLAIHRPPRVVAAGGGSPGRESLATSVRTSSSSIASFVMKMKEFRSCFGYVNEKVKDESVVPPRKASVPSVSATTTLMQEMGIRLVKEESEAAPAMLVSDGSSAVHDQSLNEVVVAAETESKEEVEAVKSDATVTLDVDAAAVTAAEVDDGEEKPLRESMMLPEERNSYRSTIGGRWCGRQPMAGSPKIVAAAAVVPEPEPESSKNGTARGSSKKEDAEPEVEGEFKWATMYRPKALEGFICKKDKALMLQHMIMTGDCGHFIFEGPPGVGKKTMIWAMLHEVFGPDNIQTHSKTRVFRLEGESRGSLSLEVVLKESSHHIEVTVSELKGYEKHVIVELIKEAHLSLSKKDPRIPENCKAMILHEADKLSSDALLYIRWLLERYKHMKVFFCCSELSKLQPIKQLCMVVHLLPPSKEEVVKVLEFIAKQEGIDLPHKLAERIADRSKNNLRQAIRSLEASWHKSYPFAEDQLPMTGWEDVIAEIAKKITEEQSPRQLFIVRGKLRTLIEHDVSSNFIFESLVEELKKHLDEPLQSQVDSLYNDYNVNAGESFEGEMAASVSREEERSKRSNDSIKRNIRHFMKIEEFVARFMSCYKSSIRNKNITSPSHHLHHQMGMSC
ncbi:hypothetical protein MLD38_023765 [Melastoma candidum]|uniref:Uncharacterized protein n=1 Tax=Melastoma candidum TaxID=119954 RepID=A0ACB9NV58_9MYRT|nr:hypothetical protein MLD38_023765 [Melastoma candidum]